MYISLKYGVSAVALLTAFSLAQAQTNEHQGGGEKGGASAQQAQGEHTGKEGGVKKPGEARGQQADEKSAKPQPGQRAQKEPEPNSSQRAKSDSTGSMEKERSGQNTGREHEPDSRQRASNMGAATKNEELGREGARTGSARANFHVTGAQKTKLHDTILHDTAIRRYHRGDINFAVEVGTRIPVSIEFFDPPVQFVEVDPEFRGYQLVVLDDEILVVDPITREIVDIIPV